MTYSPLLKWPGPRLKLISNFFRQLQSTSSLRWLGNGRTYAIGVLIITGLSVGTLVVAPRFLDPSAFGTFTLLTTLFQYASKTDLGLSQLADREIALERDDEPDAASNILRARLIIGYVILSGIIPLAMSIVWITGKLPPFDTALAIAAGGAFMIANGPVTVFRAASKVWEFTATALILQIGLTVPRLAGLVFGGVTGCFLALALWYGSLAVLLSRSVPQKVAVPSPLLPMIWQGLPLFAFNWFWELYLSSNRWISAGLSSSEDFGLFSFSANIAIVAISLVAAIAQVRYPKLLAHIGKHSANSSSTVVEREVLVLCLFLSVGVATAIIATGPMVHLVFPHFERAIPVTQALAISCVPLGVVAATSPIVISLSSRPLFHAIRSFFPAFFLLLVAMIAANRTCSITGQAWASVAVGFALFINVVLLICKLGVLKKGAAIRVIFIQAAAIVCLALVAVVS